MDLVFSDIHADISALDKILKVTSLPNFKKEYGSFSRILNLGDLLERGTHPKQVLDKMNNMSENYPVESVIGNHDEAFLYNRQVSGSSLESIATHRMLNDNDLVFFKKNKDGTFGDQEFFDKKSGIICVHGGPLNPQKITPNNAGPESWMYQKSWQRLSENEEFFSYAGYHYTAESAFQEAQNKTKNPIILCGHQHEEAVLEKNNNKISDLLLKSEPKLEKFDNFSLEKKEFQIKDDTSYLVRVGLGGPEGYYGTGDAKPHFGLIDYDQNKILLFTIN